MCSGLCWWELKSLILSLNLETSRIPLNLPPFHVFRPPFLFFCCQTASWIMTVFTVCWQQQASVICHQWTFLLVIQDICELLHNYSYGCLGSLSSFMNKLWHFLHVSLHGNNSFSDLSSVLWANSDCLKLFWSFRGKLRFQMNDICQLSYWQINHTFVKCNYRNYSALASTSQCNTNINTHFILMRFQDNFSLHFPPSPSISVKTSITSSVQSKALSLLLKISFKEDYRCV